MEPRLIVAYALILLMTAALAAWIWHATRERRAYARARREYRRERRAARARAPG